MKPIDIVKEYFPDLPEESYLEVLNVFASDIDAWGEGETAEEKLRNSLDKAAKEYYGFKRTVDEWIDEIKRNLH